MEDKVNDGAEESYMVEMMYNETTVCLVDLDRRGWMAVARQWRYRMLSEPGMSSGPSRTVDGLYMMCIKRKRGLLGCGMDIEVHVWSERRRCVRAGTCDAS